MKMEKHLVSVVIGSYNRRAFLKSTLESVRNNGMTFPYEMIVVDGGSTDGTLRWLTQQKDVITIVQHNRGAFRGKPIERQSWGYFMNLGFKTAQGKYICMISDDCLLVPGAIKNGVDLFEKKLEEGNKVGGVAFYWREWPINRDYWVGTTFGDKMFVNHGLYLREAVAKVNWIDENTYFFYHADGDLCLRMWENGYETVDSPDSYVEHYSHANQRIKVTNAERQKQDWAAYSQRWIGAFPGPFGNFPGQFISKKYQDVYQTYLLFPWFSRMTLPGRLFIRKIKNRIQKIP